MTIIDEQNFLARLIGIMRNGFSTSKKKHKFVLKGDFSLKRNRLSRYISVDDGGSAVIGSVALDEKNHPLESNGMSAEILSWDDSHEHNDMKKFLVRKIKVTIETID